MDAFFLGMPASQQAVWVNDDFGIFYSNIIINSKKEAVSERSQVSLDNLKFGAVHKWYSI